jgi:hypothetical protein
MQANIGQAATCHTERRKNKEEESKVGVKAVLGEDFGAHYSSSFKRFPKSLERLQVFRSQEIQYCCGMQKLGKYLKFFLPVSSLFLNILSFEHNLPEECDASTEGTQKRPYIPVI